MTGVKIGNLTHLGTARVGDGRFVARVLPGEEIEITGDGAVRILVPSPERVAAPCRHFKTCGGCLMQHASDNFVAHWKQDIVVRALAAQGLEPGIAQVVTSPTMSRRRAKFSARRTKKGATVGFHVRGSDLLVEVPDCKLLTKRLLEVVPALQELTKISASRKAEISFTVTESLSGPDIQIGTDLPLTEALRVSLAGFAEQYGVARLAWGDEVVVMHRPPYQQFGKARVVPPPGAFLQATHEGEAALVSAAAAVCGGARRIVDLFSGCGTFTLPLAERAEVHAVEGEAAMVAALDRGWREAPGLKRVTTEARDLFRRPLEPDELRRFDAAVIDPPRAGAEAQIATLARSDIPRIAMISCNPVTFARDAATLVAAGYHMGPVTVVDQFRWSAHIEQVAAFTRA